LQEAIQKMLQQKQDTSDMENMDMTGGEMNHDETPVDTIDHSDMDMTGGEMNHDEMPTDTTDHSNMNM
jgi:Cu(I)/Ag(I) efflux system membrane fusion protein/cobalt-zinc-cadmium efflux system membrane fusion protein